MSLSSSAIVVGLGAVALLGWPRPAASDEPACGPAAVLHGDPTIVDGVATELGRRGISTAPPPTCRTMHVEVAPQAGALVVDVTDAFGRRSQRRVARVAEVVSLIESWARPDLNADLLTGFEVERTAPAVATLVPPPAGPARDRASVALIGDGLLDVDAAGWAGATLAACVRLGPLCVGASGRYRANFRTPARREVGALATLELPFHATVVVTPGVGVGVARLATAGGGDGNGEGQQQQDQQEPETSWGLRLEAHVALAVPLARWASVELVTAGELAPFAAAGQRQNDVTLPGEPRGALRVGLGLRIGRP